MLNILYTVLTSLFGSMSTCFVLDNVFKKVIKPNAQYFLLHVCLNSYIVYITCQETLDFFLSPTIDVSEYTENSVKSASVCIGFHMYHYLTNELDFETAAELSGSRFVISTGRLAKLERALSNFMIDIAGHRCSSFLFKDIDKFNETWIF